MSVECPKCQSENTDTAAFCSDCGTRIRPGNDVKVEVTRTLVKHKEKLFAGSTFAGRYQIIEELGKGGMGQVYRALDKKLNEEVALKLIEPEIASDKKIIERFKNELKLARKVGHRSVARMYELLEYEGTHYITMEYVRGEDLKSFIRRSGQLTMGKTISLARQVSDGLKEAHRLGVIHRDLKPSNIMIDKEGNARIMDFGIARSLKAKGITGERAMIGTPEYMSPEQMEGKEADQRSDIYSLGVVLHEMVTGEVPKKPIEFNTQTHKGFNKIILKCLERDKEDRYQNVEEIVAELLYIEKSISSKEEIFSPEASEKEKPIGREWKQSLAVLPFDDLSPQRDQEYFCDGLAEELINSLTKIEDLRVMARTSSFAFKGKKLDIREIGKKLDTDTILEGSVRKAGNRLRITAQLIDVKGGHHLWSERYDRDMEDVFAIQDEITIEIVNKLKTEFDMPRNLQKERGSESLEAYDLYLKGRYYWNKFSPELTEKTIDYYKQAIEKDPKYALAYAALAEAYVMLSIGFASHPSKDAMPKARKAALKALKIDPTLVEAHVSLAIVATCYDWDPVAAEKSFKRAIELNPNHAGAHQWFEICLTFLEGKFGEAISELERAQELDPLNLYIKIRLGFMYLYLYDVDHAIELFQRVLKLEPQYALGHLSLGSAYGWNGMLEEAITEVEGAIQLSERAVAYVGTLGILYGLIGKKDKAKELLAELEGRSKKGFVSSFWVAMVYLGLGEIDKTFEWFNRAYNERDSNLLYITVAPPLDPIRNDSRFKNLLKKMGLEAMLDKQTLIQKYEKSRV